MSGSGAGTATPPTISSTSRSKTPKAHYRVLRGGSWVSAPDFVRGFVRDRLDPYARGIHFGFRCARRAEKRF